MKILDLSSGLRAIWYNKNHPLCTYLDKRPEVNPDIVCDTRELDPNVVGKDFDLIVWDPPHMNCGPKSNMSKRYGYHTTAEILATIEGTGSGVLKLCKPNTLMALKWNDHDIKLQKVFDLLPKWEPLFGHLIKSGPHSQTFWVMLKIRDGVLI